MQNTIGIYKFDIESILLYVCVCVCVCSLILLQEFIIQWNYLYHTYIHTLIHTYIDKYRDIETERIDTTVIIENLV